MKVILTHEQFLIGLISNFYFLISGEGKELCGGSLQQTAIM